MDTIPSTFLVMILKRNWIIDSFHIEEEYSGTFPYELGKIELENKFTLLKLSGQGVDQDPKNILKIDETGVIMVWGKVDYELYTKLALKFEAVDKSTHMVDTRLSVELQIDDINDHVPTFITPFYAVSLEESATGGLVTTTIAKDSDNSKSVNGTFDLRIVSVTPKPTDVVFFMYQTGTYGNISFRGCLDYEKAKTYTILVEAKDRGDKVRLSSTSTVVVNIEDKNNHLPVFTGKTYTATINEQEVDVEVVRLQATDRDTKGTDAWKAKYIIHGEKGDNFRIDTNPETNEGVLYVIKPLDYEDQSALNLTISVTNVEQHFTCKVLSKPADGNWMVEQTSDKHPPLSTCVVTVNVEDVNDPPVFKPASKKVIVFENVEVGTYLETLMATDKDVSHGNKIVYVKGEDPGGWVAVDPKTGAITTVNTLDRESSLVKNNKYTVTVYGVDDGIPPLTGTGTLFIQLRDINDHVPKLDQDALTMCLSEDEGSSQANLTAIDLDDTPYGGPFRFKLHGDVKDKWSISPQYGNLLLLEVFDQQDHSAQYNLSVHVCYCDPSHMPPSCKDKRGTTTVGAGGAVVVMFLIPILLLLVIVGLKLSCKRESKPMPYEWPEQYLIPFNTEHPGNDCKKILILQKPGGELGDYEPHLYNEEGDLEEGNPQLDPIVMEEFPFYPDMFLDAGPKFNNLATHICSPSDITHTYKHSHTKVTNIVC
ncbi:unnamed protein product [Merluccius merluccius]